MRSVRCALTRPLSLQSLHFPVQRCSLRPSLGSLPLASPQACADRPLLSSPWLSRHYLAELTDQASASLGFRLQQPPGGPSLWATSLTNFPVGREIHVQQNGGSVPQALTQFPLCLWALILKSVPDCSLSLFLLQLLPRPCFSKPYC